MRLKMMMTMLLLQYCCVLVLLFVFLPASVQGWTTGPRRTASGILSPRTGRRATTALATASSSSNNNNNTNNSVIHLGPLVSTCVEACQRGCDEIRNVQMLRDDATDDDDDGGLGVVRFKDPTDPKSALTIADTNAQRVIIGALRAEWGLAAAAAAEKEEGTTTTPKVFQIIGEEDGNAAVQHLDATTYAALDRTRFDEEMPVDDDDRTTNTGIAAERITVYVDPLDGTREFVEGRLENCQVLIGICLDHRPVAGVIGIPFPTGQAGFHTNRTAATIIYGIDGIGSGTTGAILSRGPYPLAQHMDRDRYPRPHFATSDLATTGPFHVMDACREAAIVVTGGRGSIVPYGGAGNKLLAAALGEVEATFQHKVGGPWDLCAPHALITAMGGTITDLFGDELQIYDPQQQSYGHEKGYIATPPSAEYGYHYRLAKKFMTLPEVKQYKQYVEEKSGIKKDDASKIQ